MTSTPRPFPWKRNLAVLWVAQVVTTLGFSFTFPFFPVFFQELGVQEAERAAFWSGASAWVFGLGMALFSPIWGMIGDRFGRKPNVVRAMVLGGAILILAGYSQTPAQLLISRFFVGATSGVMPTIMALVAAHTPRERLAVATGATQSGLFFGTALGPLFGGIIFDAYGMRASFWATGLALFLATAMVILLVREDFRRPERVRRHPLQPFADFWRMSTAKGFLPLLVVVFFVHGGTLVMMPALPGITDDFRGGQSATVTGIVFMVIGIASSASSILMGLLAAHAGLRQVFMMAAAGAAAVNVLPYFANTLALFTAAVFLANLMSGGLAGLASGLIALRTSRAQQGAAFGANQVAVSLGIAVGPLAGGSASVAFGLRSVFLVNIVVFTVLFTLAATLLRGGREGQDEGVSLEMTPAPTPMPGDTAPPTQA